MTGPSTTPPIGVVALLFTDIEGSTSLAARLGSQWPRVLSEHHQIVSAAIAAEGGYVDGTEGDAFFATFGDPVAAARAAVAAQRELRAHAWPESVGELRVRMGLHVGFVERGPIGYVGLEVHRAARVGAAAHGGQLLVTGAAREMLGDALTADYLGSFRLKDFPAPVQLYSAVIDGRGSAAFPPPRTFDARPTNLPAGLPSLVGRDEDLEEIRQALLQGGDRVVCLTGRGGSGKTSLALVAGGRLLDDYAGGVWWIDLTQVTDPGRVLDAVARTVGADREVQASSAEAVTGRLSGSGRVLLILDNMEHLSAAGPDVAGLLRALPELQVLATSQVPLRLPGERVIALDALDAESALVLIEEVVSRRGVAFSPNQEEREALGDVVALLDGLPLALELAAARLSLLSPRQLRDRLRSSSDLLKDSTRPERQRSLGATVDWTLGLLDDAPRQLFIRMAVFAGPVELEEVELVTGGDGLDVLEALSTLLDVALVRRVERGDGKIRFALTEALRQIAAAHLDGTPDAERWRVAHAERQLDLLGASVTSTMVAEERAKAALPEGRGALRWAQQVRHPLLDELRVTVGTGLSLSGHLREAAEVLAPLADSPPATARLRSKSYRARGHLASVLGDQDGAVRLLDLALANADDDVAVLEATLLRGLAQLFAGRLEPGLADHREATRLARKLDPVALGTMLVFEAQAMIAVGDLAAAASLLDEGRRVGEPVQSLGMRGIDTMEGDLAMAAGRPADALEPYARSLEGAQESNDPLQILFDLRGMANALGALERDEECLEVLGLADMQAQEVGGKTDMGEHLQGDAPVREALERMGPERTEAARLRGQAVVPGRRVARACELGRAVVRV